MVLSLNAIRLNFEELREAPFAGIGANYTAVGTPLEHPARLLLIHNFTDALLLFSIDGVTDHFVLNEGQSWTVDVTTNASRESKGLYLGQNSSLYVKQSGVPTSGSVYFSVVYGDPGF